MRFFIVAQQADSARVEFLRSFLLIDCVLIHLHGAGARDRRRCLASLQDPSPPVLFRRPRRDRGEIINMLVVPTILAVDQRPVAGISWRWGRAWSSPSRL